MKASKIYEYSYVGIKMYLFSTLWYKNIFECIHSHFDLLHSWYSVSSVVIEMQHDSNEIHISFFLSLLHIVFVLLLLLINCYQLHIVFIAKLLIILWICQQLLFESYHMLFLIFFFILFLHKQFTQISYFPRYSSFILSMIHIYNYWTDTHGF